MNEINKEKPMYSSQADNPFAAFPPVALPAAYPVFRLASHILIDFEAHAFEVGGKPVLMTHREWRLLAALVKKYIDSPRGYVSADFLVKWVIPHYTDLYDPEQAIAQIVSVIRKKWGETPYRPCFLVGVRGRGYQLRPEHGYGFLVPYHQEKPD